MGQSMKRTCVSLLIIILLCITALLVRSLWGNGVYTGSISFINAGWTKKKMDYLVLVNWDNPIESEAVDLVRISDVMDRNTVSFNTEHYIDRTTGIAADKMFEEAQADGVTGYIINNAYRSVESQTAIWERRIQQDSSYGNDPYNNPVKAMPGNKSEHSTGLAVDILCQGHNKADDAFGETAEGGWLAENAHKHGFILRYPKDKEHITGVIYEPWHFRYVGIDAATEIYEQGWCLEEYLEEHKE